MAAPSGAPSITSFLTAGDAIELIDRLFVIPA
jgi:hypothetical protein